MSPPQFRSRDGFYFTHGFLVKFPYRAVWNVTEACTVAPYLKALLVAMRLEYRPEDGLLRPGPACPKEWRVAGQPSGYVDRGVGLGALASPPDMLREYGCRCHRNPSFAVSAA